MTWSLKAADGHLAHTSGDHLAHCQPCGGLLTCAWTDATSACLNVDICNIALCESCMISPHCGFRLTPAVLKPVSLAGMMGRHRLTFGNRSIYGYAQDFCRFSSTIENSLLTVDGWKMKQDGDDRTYSCTDAAQYIEQPVTIRGPYQPWAHPDVFWEQSLIAHPNALQRRVTVFLRYALFGETLRLGCEISTTSSRIECDFILFRGWVDVPEGWIDGSGNPTSPLTIDNVFTCVGNDCGSFETYQYMYDNVASTIAPFNIAPWDPRISRNYFDGDKIGRFVVGVGGQVTIGASSAVSPCPTPAACTTTIIDVTDCNDGDGPEPEDPDYPGDPDPQPEEEQPSFPFRAFKLCGGDGTILGHTFTNETADKVISLDGLDIDGNLNRCYQLTGPRLLLGRDDFRLNNLGQLQPTRYHNNCDACWVIRLDQCGSTANVWMFLADFLQYGPVFRSPDGCFTYSGDLEDAVIASYDPAARPMITMHPSGEENMDSSYGEGECLPCQAAEGDCISEPIRPPVTSPGTVWFGGGEDYPAGMYAVRYLYGAMKYGASGGWQVNAGPFNRYRILFNDGADETAAPGGTATFDTVEEASLAYAGEQVVINHTGGKIGVYLDDLHADNVAGDPTPTFCLV